MKRYEVNPANSVDKNKTGIYKKQKSLEIMIMALWRLWIMDYRTLDYETLRNLWR